MEFSELLSREMPERELEVAGFTLKFRAISAKALDDLITANPGEGEQVFGDKMIPKLVALSSVEPAMTQAQVEKLFDSWPRPDVNRIQEAVFRLNFAGEDDKLPLSASA